MTAQAFGDYNAGIVRSRLAYTADQRRRVGLPGPERECPDCERHFNFSGKDRHTLCPTCRGRKQRGAT